MNLMKGCCVSRCLKNHKLKFFYSKVECGQGKSRLLMQLLMVTYFKVKENVYFIQKNYRQNKYTTKLYRNNAIY